jgi:allantoicase
MPHFTTYPDLASRDLAGRVVSANDDLFAPRQSLNLPKPPVHAVDAFGHMGKVYDGWETRRRRTPGFDWAIIRLGVPGIVHGVVVDTAFFKGNYPPFVSVEGASVEGYPEDALLESLAWTTLVERSPCEGDTENYYEVASDRRWTHVRLSIHPDGGVARFRVHGEVVLDPRFLTTTVDLLALEHGGRLLDTSDAFYASPENLILPSRARTTGEGWENARRRGPGNDWATFTLAARGEPTLVEVDTSYFIGNAPGAVRIQAADATAGPVEDGAWWDVVPTIPVLVDTRHHFLVGARRPATHLRLDVYPDGGLTRLRCFGEIDEAERKHLYARFFGSLPEGHREFPDTMPVAPSRALPADEV